MTKLKSLRVNFWNKVIGKLTGLEDKIPELRDVFLAEEVIESGQQAHTLEMLDAVDFSGPKKITAAAHAQKLRTRYHQYYFRKAVEEITQVARQKNLSLVWLKGANIFNDLSYPPGTRRLSDLDLLVRKEELEEWDEVFQQLGYRPHRSIDWVVSEDFSPEVSSTHYQKNKNGKSILLDIHWHLIDFPARRALGKPDFSMQPIWERAVKNRLAPEHRIIYQLDHAFAHNYSYLKSFADIVFLFQEYNIDQEQLIRAKQEMQIDFTLSLGSYALNYLFRRRDCFQPLVAFVQQTTENDKKFVRRCLNKIQPSACYLLFSLCKFSTLRKKIKFLKFNLFPPVDAISKVNCSLNKFKFLKIYIQRFIKVIYGGVKAIKSILYKA